MTTRETNSNALLGQDEALGDYIDALLQPAATATQAPIEKPVRAIDPLQWSSLIRALKTMDAPSIAPLMPQTQTVSVLRCRVGRLEVGVPSPQIERVVACPPYIAEEIRQSNAKMLEDDGAYQRIAVLQHIVFPLPHLAPPSFPSDAATLSLVVLTRPGRALVCDSVGKTDVIADSEITWRGQNTARRWLLGTSLTQRIALIDVDELFK